MIIRDYRKLNQVIIKDKTPLPLIGEVIDKLKETKYFNKLDLIWEYNNVQIKKGDEWKAAFLTNKSLFKPQVIYFELCNSLGVKIEEDRLDLFYFFFSLFIFFLIYFSIFYF